MFFGEIVDLFVDVVSDAVYFVVEIIDKGLCKIIGNLSSTAASSVTSNASELFKHSLQNNPSDLKFTNGDRLVETIKNSNQFKNAIKEKVLKNLTAIFYNEEVNIIFDETKDLHTSLHKITFKISGTLINGSGNLSIYASDDYDFKNESNYGFLTFINNIANVWEEAGWINIYTVILDFDYCVNY